MQHHGNHGVAFFVLENLQPSKDSILKKVIDTSLF
jgi:uncharacterized protein YutD